MAAEISATLPNLNHEIITRLPFGNIQRLIHRIGKACYRGCNRRTRTAVCQLS